MLIDAHNHPNWHGHGGRKILENMDEQGIDQMWLLTWECPESDYDPKLNGHLPPTGGVIPFRDVLSVSREAPDRFILGYMPDPKRPDAIDRLRAAVDIYGVKLAGELKVRVPFDDPDLMRMYEYCGEAGLPITIHLEYPIDRGSVYPRPNTWYGGTMDALERAVQANPATIFIGHAKGFWAHISGDGLHDKIPSPKGDVLPGGQVIEMMNKYDNLYADLSGNGVPALNRDHKFSREFVIAFQDKLLFARDHFHNNLMDLLLQLDLPEDVFEKVKWKNAARMVNSG